MYRIPETHRLTDKTAKGLSFISKDMLRLVTDSTSSHDGFFSFPSLDKKGGHFFLVRASSTPGWRMIAVNIPSQGRSPTWEEMNHIKSFFFDADDVVAMFHPGQHLYIADNRYWLHLFYSDNKMTLPPLFTNQFDKLREANFFVKLWRAVKRTISEQYKKKK